MIVKVNKIIHNNNSFPEYIIEVREIKTINGEIKRSRWMGWIGGVVSYCEKLLKENNIKELKLGAVGDSIGTIVIVVELFKTIKYSQISH